MELQQQYLEAGRTAKASTSKHLLEWPLSVKFQKCQTSIAILINVSYVFHRQTKHGLPLSIERNWNNIIPVFPLPVNIDEDGSSNILIFQVELRGSNSEVFPPVQTRSTHVLMPYLRSLLWQASLICQFQRVTTETFSA